MDLFSIGQFSPNVPEETLIAESKDGEYRSFLFREGKMVGSILLGDASLSAKVKAAIESKKDFTAILTEEAEVQSILQAL